ncbi:MAG: mannose-1-phosphate guanylyltransferase [Thermoplasmatota archaeon]
MMYSAIMVGGVGTRLWPISRERFPKQFTRIIGGRSLFQETLDRAANLSSPEKVYLITNREQSILAREQMWEIGVEVPEENVLIEPEGRNTLPAMLYCLKTLREREGDVKVAVLPSDHILEEDEDYWEAFRKAEELADEYLVTFGIRPKGPNTGYGYISPGEDLGPGYLVREFVEKPDRETAEEYLERGYLWNSGMFVFRTTLFLDECRCLQPELYQAFKGDLVTAYRESPSISVDNGIMERTDRAAVVPLGSYWNDVGSFDALWELLDKDGEGNAVQGECLAVDSNDNLILGNRLVAAIGLRRQAIVDTEDALLVCPLDRAEEVKGLVERLRDMEDRRAEVHRTVNHEWGYTTLLDEGRQLVERVGVKPGYRAGLEVLEGETWVVLSGEAELGEEIFREGQSVPVEPGTVLRNPRGEMLEILRVRRNPYP